ncbi:MAG: Alpha/Beta hydrolase protein [Monoraphidium minutum]|nr:MAG: Alpha/Beta hydrolase protein [Monoraphidium minutum]
MLARSEIRPVPSAGDHTTWSRNNRLPRSCGRVPRQLRRPLAALPAESGSARSTAPHAPHAQSIARSPAEPLAFSVRSREHALAAQLLLPSDGRPPRAAVVFVHGYAEHSGRKLPALRALADAAGAAVAAVDLHGHGRSEPRDGALRGVVRSYAHVVDDALALAAALRDPGGPAGGGGGGAQLGGLPFFIGGYSMGACAALHAALRAAGTPQAFAGCFLVSPALGLREPQNVVEQAQLWAGEWLNSNFPLWRAVAELDAAALNPEPGYAADYGSDPLVVRGRIAVCTVHSILTAAALIKAPEAVAALAPLPVHILSCAGDRVTPAADAAAFAAALRAAGGEAELEVVEGALHDLLSGRDGPAHAERIAAFVARRI